MQRRDYELWLALHTDCPPKGCGGCAPLGEIELPPVVIQAARAEGLSVEAFVHKAVVEACDEITASLR